jgi:hypothetical protein
MVAAAPPEEQLDANVRSSRRRVIAGAPTARRVVAWARTRSSAPASTRRCRRLDGSVGATAAAGWFADRATQALSIIRREPGAIASNQLTALAMDRSGRLWVGTEGSGVSRRTADGRRWELMNLLDGLPSDSVRVLEANGDTLWIGTTRGFSLWNGRQITGALPDDGITASFDTTFTSASGPVALQGDVWAGDAAGHRSRA